MPKAAPGLFFAGRARGSATEPVSSLSILVLCPHYLPDTAPTGEVMASLCERWIAQGHRVEVISSLPWYKNHAVAEGWRGRLLHTEPAVWGRIRRWYPFAMQKAGLWRRVLGFVGFSVLVGLDALRAARRCDVVFAMSPPLTLGAAGWIASVVGRAPLVFNVQDIFPDAGVHTKVLRNRWIVSLASSLERWLYRKAAAVTVLSQDMADNVQAKLHKRVVFQADKHKGLQASKVHVIPNSADIERIVPLTRHNSYRAQLGLADSGIAVVMYAGNLGHSQSLDLVIGAAQRCLAQGRQDICFVINGEGVARAAIAAAAKRLSNLHLVGWQPPERLGEVLAAADIHLVLLRAGLGASSMPSKLHSVLAAGRPVLASVDEDSEVARLVQASGAGISVAPDNLDAFFQALMQMVDAPEILQQMGQQARQHAITHASPEQLADLYLELFAQVIVS